MSSAPPILKSFFKKFKKTKKSNFEIDFKKIDISLISIHAIKTIEVLEDNGFEAYLVGGAVRDLLFGINLKILMWLQTPPRIKYIIYLDAPE